MISLILFCIIVLLIFLDYFIQYALTTEEFRRLPAMKRTFLVGNALDLIGSPAVLFGKARRFANACRNKGNIFRGQVLHFKIVSLYEPDDIEVLLSNVKYIQKGMEYDLLHPWLQEGLLTSKGEKWQRRRKILTPAFHFNILRQFLKVFVDKSNALVLKLQKEVGKEETEILPFITDFTLHSITETAMGTNLDSAQSIMERYKNALYDMGEIFVRKFTRIWLQFPVIYWLTADYTAETRLTGFLHGFTTSVIRERRVARSADDGKLKVEEYDEDAALGMKKRLAMLDLLLNAEAEGRIDEGGIREEVDTFMFEGHDTITMALMFLLMLLANHPEVQERILREYNEVMGDSDRQPTIEDFSKMSYLEMCIKEGLRLYPSVPFMARYINDEMVLKKYTIPPKTGVYVHIFDLHRNPNIYPNPDKFDPDRFLPENIRGRHPYAYIPFSAGPRNCIGQRFAMLEEKAVLSAIIKNFKLEPVTRPEDVIFICDVVLRCQNKIKVKFSAR